MYEFVSMVAHEGKLYALTKKGTLFVINVRDGQEQFQKLFQLK